MNEREPYTHRCWECPPPPGADFYGELCGKCLDEVWEDWARSDPWPEYPEYEDARTLEVARA